MSTETQTASAVSTPAAPSHNGSAVAAPSGPVVEPLSLAMGPQAAAQTAPPTAPQAVPQQPPAQPPAVQTQPVQPQPMANPFGTVMDGMKKLVDNVKQHPVQSLAIALTGFGVAKASEMRRVPGQQVPPQAPPGYPPQGGGHGPRK